MRRILLTGAAGGVGRAITPMLKTLYPGLVLSDLDPPENTHGLPFVRADLADMAATQAAVAGADGIIHLGGYSVEGPWETILSANIVGCRNMFEASRLAGVRRIVFASSNHVVGFYPRSEKIAQDVTVLPDTRYGVSKAFGEALGAMYAMKHGIGVACLRIGNVGETPLDESASPSAAEQRYQMICERAYVYATERGFEPGGELDDWLRAEREIDAQMGTHRGGSEAGT